MILYMDCGNSRIKWWLTGESQTIAGKFGYESVSRELSSINERSAKLKSVVLSSVLGASKQGSLLRELKQKFDCPLRQCVVSRRTLGVTCAYDDPQKLGVDRWLALVTAWYKYRNTCLVVDLGTAATLDIVEKNGTHLGGYIVSGLGLSIKGLLSGTGNVAPDAMDRKALCLDYGRSTTQAVYNGAITGLVSLIDTTFSRILERDQHAMLLLTGGDAELVSLHLAHRCLLEENLVFAGMRLFNDMGLLIDAV